MTEEQVIKKGQELIEKSQAAYLTTVNSKGYPETRAMLNLKNPKLYPDLIDFFKKTDKTELYFTTNTSSAKIKQIEENNAVSVYYCDPVAWHGFLYQGDIEIINDSSVKHAIWLDSWTMYYPEGKDSQDYAVLKLKPKYIKSYYKFHQSQIEI